MTVYALVANALRTASPVLGTPNLGQIGAAIGVPPGTTPPSSSGSGIAIRASDAAGGQQIAGLQNFFKTEGLLSVVLGDKVNPHGIDIHGASPPMVQALPWFRINGIPTCRQGHQAACGHATSGRSWFHLNG